MIKVGEYFWTAGIPIPECDGCNKKKATYKIYTDRVGIRLCADCLNVLKKGLK